MIVHAGLIARWSSGWRGVLIEGTSGSGKSDLALRCLDIGFRLVADDRVRLFRSGDRLFGRAPPALFGLTEARGLGIVPAPALPFCAIELLLHCETNIERLPPIDLEERLGVGLPRLSLAALEASAPAKLCRALEWLGGDAQRD